MEQESILVATLILIAGFISIEIGISTAILEIMAGVISANFLGLHSIYWIDYLADFGLLGLMFFAGFETDPKLLKKNLYKNLTLGITSYIVPFVIVFTIAIAIFNLGTEAAILLGISLSTTSLALVYAVLRERNMSSTVTGQIILGGAMIADVLSMLSLTLLVGDYGIYTVIYTILLFAFLYLSPKIGRFIFQRYKGHTAEIEIKFILLLLLTMPFFSERVGISEAVFAFLLGILFSEMIEEDELVEEKLKGLVFGFLAPAFFFKAGLLMNLTHLTNINVLYLVTLFGTVAFLGKYLGVYIVSKKIIEEKTVSAVGLFFNFRLTFGIVAALFGLENGYITAEMYAAVLTIILLTSAISSIALKAIPHEL